MKSLWKIGPLRGLLLFLAIMGPGIITANVDNDAGGITTYSVTGATLGYKLLWVFIPMILALIVIQEMSARMGAVTGKGLSDLIRERFGVKVILLVMVVLLVANLGNTVSEFAGVAASTELLGISKYIAVPIVALVVWWIVIKGSYKMVERVFLFASALYLCYIPSTIMARPDWGQVARYMVVPSFSFDPVYLTLLIGLIGTTIAPWMQFYLQSSVVEKGITIKQYEYTRLDVIVGCFMTCVIAAFIVVACASTLNVHHIHIATASDAALAFRPLAGPWAYLLFAFGLFNASLFSASILPLSTAYYICEALGLEAGVDKQWDEAPVFYWMYTAFVAVGAGIIMIPDIPLIGVMLWSQVANGILLPFVLIFMLTLINNKDIMGRYTNSRGFNAVSWVTVAIMISLTGLLIAISIFPHLLA